MICAKPATLTEDESGLWDEAIAQLRRNGAACDSAIVNMRHHDWAESSRVQSYWSDILEQLRRAARGREVVT
jgi:hypothetical protein